MFRVVPVFAPAWLPALLFFGVLLLQGCSLLPKKEASTDTTAPALVRSGDTAADETGKDGDRGPRRAAFTVDVRGPDNVREYLALHVHPGGNPLFLGREARGKAHPGHQNQAEPPARLHTASSFFMNFPAIQSAPRFNRSANTSQVTPSAIQHPLPST